MDPHKLKDMFAIGKVPVIPLSLLDIPLQAQKMVGRMSISGVQPKLSIRLDRKRGELVPTPMGGEYILKPQIQQFRHTPENENCCMDIAAELAIDVPPHCLLPLKDGSQAYVVKRFDRADGEKLHQEDFFQILDKKDKYRGSLEQIGAKLKEVSSVPGLDVQLFFEHVVFNFLIGNGDGHFKNYSVLYRTDGSARLSPAYDIVCSRILIPDEEDSALAMNGRKNKLTREDFDIFADTLKIPARVRYEKFAGRSDLFARHIRDSLLPDDLKEKFSETVLSRFARLKV